MAWPAPFVPTISGVKSRRGFHLPGRVRGVADDPRRTGTALTGILFVPRTGLPWEMLPAEMGCGSGMTCWRSLRDWQAAGVRARLHRALPGRLRGRTTRREPRQPGRRICPGQERGTATGPNPTDRGEPGTKRHLVVDARGRPLGLAFTGADRHDSVMSGSDPRCDPAGA